MTLQESTIFGSSAGTEHPKEVLIDENNVTYIVGTTNGNSLLVNAFDTTLVGGEGYIIAFYENKSIVYATYLGGSSSDIVIAADLSSNGNLVVVGYTDSTDFPLTVDAQRSTFSGTETFITEISPNGTLVYSSYLGGSSLDFVNDVLIDDTITLIGSTTSTDFPTSADAFNTSNQGATDVYLTRINTTTHEILYSTYFGGNDYDNGINVIKNGDTLLCVGHTGSDVGFPQIDATYSKIADYDIFLAELDLNQMNFTFSTIIGGESSQSTYGAKVSNNAIYIVGYTEGDFDGLYTPERSRQSFDGFVLQIDLLSHLIISGTYIGGSDTDKIASIDIDDSGKVYLGGDTLSEDFPIIGRFDDHISTNVGYSDLFVTVLSSDLSALLYSVTFGNDGDNQFGKLMIENGLIYMIASGNYQGNLRSTFALNPLYTPGGFIDLFYLVGQLTTEVPLFSTGNEVIGVQSAEDYEFSLTNDYTIRNTVYQWLYKDIGDTNLVDWSLKTPIGEGYHYLRLKSEIDFNQIIHNDFIFYIDDTCPLIQLLGVANQSEVEINSMLQFLIVDDTLDEVVYSLNEGLSTTLNEPYTIQVPSEPGSLEIDIHAIDKAGNQKNKHYKLTLVEPAPISTPTVTEFMTETEQETETITESVTVTSSIYTTAEISDSTNDTSQTSDTYLPFSSFLALIAAPFLIRKRIRKNVSTPRPD